MDRTGYRVVEVLTIDRDNSFDPRLRQAASPFVNFGVAIRHGETTGAVVISRRCIDDKRLMRIEEPCIIDAVRMFINEHPCARRAGISQIRELDAVLVDIVPRTLQVIAFSQSDVSRKTPAADPAERSLDRRDEIVRRTFEDVFGFCDVRGYASVFVAYQEIYVGVVCASTSIYSPIEPALNPTDPPLRVARNSGVWSAVLSRTAVESDDDPVGVVMKIHVPSHHELPFVVHAIDTLRLLFRFAQRRQQHGRKNGDDGDDNE